MSFAPCSPASECMCASVTDTNDVRLLIRSRVPCFAAKYEAKHQMIEVILVSRHFSLFLPFSPEAAAAGYLPPFAPSLSP